MYAADVPWQFRISPMQLHVLWGSWTIGHRACENRCLRNNLTHWSSMILCMALWRQIWNDIYIYTCIYIFIFETIGRPIHSMIMMLPITLYERHGVSNHRELHWFFFKSLLNIPTKASLYWGESTNDRWIPLTTGSVMHKAFLCQDIIMWVQYGPVRIACSMCYLLFFSRRRLIIG